MNDWEDAKKIVDKLKLLRGKKVLYKLSILNLHLI
jgi:hypothetical protein